MINKKYWRKRYLLYPGNTLMKILHSVYFSVHLSIHLLWRKKWDCFQGKVLIPLFELKNKISMLYWWFDNNWLCQLSIFVIIFYKLKWANSTPRFWWKYKLSKDILFRDDGIMGMRLMCHKPWNWTKGIKQLFGGIR